MRTKRQRLYDRLYYTLELDLFKFFRNLDCRRSVRGIKFDKAFYQKYRQEVLPYWKQYGLRPGVHWYKYFYHMTGELDARYIPDDIHHRYIIPYFDNISFVRSLEDKNLHSVLFRGVKRPETIYKHSSGEFCNDDFSPISQDEAISRCLQEGQYILKPTRDTGQGQDVKFFSSQDDPDAIRAMLRSYNSIDYIVQRIMVQHPALAHFNPSSVNTIRAITLVYHEKAYFLSAVLRIGQETSRVDNLSRGGYQAIIRPDGTLEKYAYTKTNGNVEQTAGGLRFEGFQIPCWDKIKQTTLDLALHLPHLRFIGWDLALDAQGEVVLIEYNVDFGQNQENCGPTFGDMTDEILDEIFISHRKALLI